MEERPDEFTSLSSARGREGTFFPRTGLGKVVFSPDVVVRMAQGDPAESHHLCPGDTTLGVI